MTGRPQFQHVDLGPRPYARWATDSLPVPASALQWLAERIGELTPAAPPVDPADLEVPPSRLGADAAEQLRTAVGARYLETSDRARLRHAGGQSYPDVLRRRAGVPPDLPDAIARPADHDQTVALLAVCNELGLAVVPYGGGTSVVGGVDPRTNGHSGVVTVDVSRLDPVIRVDETSRLAKMGAGATATRVESALAEYGLTLGHFPQSFARASIGGFVATRSVGQASTGYGRIDDLVATLRVATPTGALQLGTGTPNAAGPDPRVLFIGSEGVLGIITELSLRVVQAPELSRYEMWALPSFSEGLEVIRGLRQQGVAPDVVRLSDQTETETMQVMAGWKGRAAEWMSRLRGLPSAVFCVVGWEGPMHGPRSVARRRRDAAGMLRAGGGVPLGTGAGEAWQRQRFAGPLQRDALIDAGVLVETLETAATWSALPELYEAVTEALRGQLPTAIVQAHVSHLYPSGASLYFTVFAPAAETVAGSIARWSAAKAAASEAIVRVRGTITHHHAIGRTHADYLEAEIGPLSLAALRAVKATLDPNGIMNPGVLLRP